MNYRIDRNNYHLKPKLSNIQTPPAVSQFIFELLKKKITKGEILDPCCGEGNLLVPWTNKEGYRIHSYTTTGIDINQSSKIPKQKFHVDLAADFLNLDKLPKENYGFHLLEGWKLRNDDGSAKFPPSLILCNPPFNGYSPKLGSEVWLDKIIELFGKEVPIVLFAPIGFRLNLTRKSSRWKKLNNGDYPIINSIIALPKNIFEGVIFHSEILIFNIKGLKSHYFLPTNHESN